MQPLIRRYATLIMGAMDGGGQDFAKKFVQYLKKRGHLSLLPAVVARVERMSQSKAGVVVRIAHASDAEKFAKSIASALTLLHIEAGKYSVAVDERVVGGFAVRGKGKLVDRTYRTALVNLYQKIIS